MTPDFILRPGDWDKIRLVVFDVDGTLYNQRLLRALLLRDLLLDAASGGGFRAIRILTAYRRIRERWGAEEAPFVEGKLLDEAARQVGAPAAQVAAVVTEWIGQRPLRYLGGCRYSGVSDLFSGLKRQGKLVGILSDYPAAAKLAALGLDADLVVSPGDPGVGFLKPHTCGIDSLLRAAGVTPEAAVLIGDRVDRDGVAARRSGVHPLIRSTAAVRGWQTFPRYDAPLFASLLHHHA